MKKAMLLGLIAAAASLSACGTSSPTAPSVVSRANVPAAHDELAPTCRTTYKLWSGRDGEPICEQ